jgi:hypothetical protein
LKKVTRSLSRATWLDSSALRGTRMALRPANFTKSYFGIVATVLAVVASQWAWGAGDGSSSSTVSASAAEARSVAPQTVAEVTVTARRIELEKRVSQFVNQLATVENSDGLPRWLNPVCPLVSGLPRQDGEFVLGRVSEIAHVVGAPLAGEKCHPNLYILVSLKPRDLLKAMEKRNREFTFGFYSPPPPSVTNRFIETPRAVRVWYNTQARNLVGGTLIRFPGDAPPKVEGTGSLISNGATWSLERVFVIVDQRRLHGVTRGQLADYISMVGLADLNPDAKLGDAPTILNLFDDAPEKAAAGMSDWDQAFLKSLYTTEQKSKLQRSQMTRQTVREVAP